MENATQAVVETARTLKVGSEIVLASGVRVRLCKVSQLLIDEAVNSLIEPTVPRFFDTDRNLEMDNPNDPAYLAAVVQYERKQSQAAIDAAVLWGIDLLDPLPTDDTWLRKLKFYARRGRMDLSGYNLDDQLELEFVYKRYCALNADELGELLPVMISGVTPEDVRKARASFQGDETRAAD